MNDLKTQLEEMVDVAQWEWLEAHALKGNMILVAASLSLVEVGLAMAEDNVNLINQWLSDGWIYRPTAAQMDYWQQNNDVEFDSLIVQPFILSKEKGLPK